MSVEGKTLTSKVVNSVAYRQGQRIGEAPVEGIRQLIQDPQNFEWIGLREPDQAPSLNIQEEFGLHELAIEDAQKAHQRPEQEHDGDTPVLVAQTASTVDLRPERAGIHLCARENLLIASRPGCPASHSKARQRRARGTHRRSLGPGFAVPALLDDI